jgi:hypothetical protein
MQTTLDNVAALNKNHTGRGKAFDALTLLAGVRQPNSAGEVLAAEVASGLLQCFAQAIAEHNSDPVVIQGTPPLTRSMVNRATALLGIGLGVTLRSSEARVLEGIMADVWRGGVQQEIASVLALVGHTASQNPADAEPALVQSLTKQFLELPWCQPFFLWGHGVVLRHRYIGESIDPELQRVIDESARLKTENDRLTQNLNFVREAERKTSQDLERTRSDLKAAVAEQGNLQRKLDQVMATPSAADGDSLEHRLRVILVRAAAPGLLIDPHIPPKKVLNARLECKVPAAERVLALMDLTFFGSAKDAVVFGTEGIYCHYTSTQFSIAYGELRYMNVRPEARSVKLDSQGGERVINITGTDYPADRFCALLKELASACAVQ